MRESESMIVMGRPLCGKEWMGWAAFRTCVCMEGFSRGESEFIAQERGNTNYLYTLGISRWVLD